MVVCKLKEKKKSYVVPLQFKSGYFDVMSFTNISLLSLTFLTPFLFPFSPIFPSLASLIFSKHPPEHFSFLPFFFSPNRYLPCPSLLFPSRPFCHASHATVQLSLLSSSRFWSAIPTIPSELLSQPPLTSHLHMHGFLFVLASVLTPPPRTFIPTSPISTPSTTQAFPPLPSQNLSVPPYPPYITPTIHLIFYFFSYY